MIFSENLYTHYSQSENMCLEIVILIGLYFFILQALYLFLDLLFFKRRIIVLKDMENFNLNIGNALFLNFFLILIWIYNT